MVTKVFMEALSPTMEEGKVVSWNKNEGDEVKTGDILAEVETDKAVMELQARGDGVLRKVLAPAGATVEVGTLVAVVAAADDDIEQMIADAQATPRAPEEREETEPPERHQPPQAPAVASSPATAPTAPTGEGIEGTVRASPLARRLARERGIHLAVIRGSGPGGRIIKRDVEEAQVATLPTLMPDSGYEDVPLSQMRKTIAKRLAQSLGPVPHFYLTTEIDMGRAAELREELNAIDDAIRISFNDIIVKVAATSLRQHRECNAWWQDAHVRYFHDVHIAMAVAIDDGLITPVIRNAHLKSLREIAAESRDLIERARARKLAPEEYTGGTFSVSNLGMFDIDEFTAVINPPEAGILAVGRIIEKPVALDGELAVRRRMRVTMSCDHRVIDGATGARFLQTVRRMLENPLMMVW